MVLELLYLNPYEKKVQKAYLRDSITIFYNRVDPVVVVVGMGKELHGGDVTINGVAEPIVGITDYLFGGKHHTAHNGTIVQAMKIRHQYIDMIRYDPLYHFFLTDTFYTIGQKASFLQLFFNAVRKK